MSEARAAGWRLAGGLEQCLQSSLVGIQSGPLAREVLMTQQQQQKRKGGKGRKGSCRARCHGDPKEV